MLVTTMSSTLEAARRSKAPCEKTPCVAKAKTREAPKRSSSRHERHTDLPESIMSSTMTTSRPSTSPMSSSCFLGGYFELNF